jgi:hypothetical protein
MCVLCVQPLRLCECVLCVSMCVCSHAFGLLLAPPRLAFVELLSQWGLLLVPPCSGYPAAHAQDARQCVCVLCEDNLCVCVSVFSV